MGFMDLAAFREEVNLSLGEMKQSSNDRLDRWINSAYYELANHSRMSWNVLKTSSTITTVAGQGSYAAPARYAGMVAVRDVTNKRVLLKAGDGEISRLSSAPASKLTYWARQGANIVFVPAPKNAGETIELDYYVYPELLEDSTDVTILPPWTDMGIVYLALRTAMNLHGDVTRGQYWQQTFNVYLSNQMTENETEMAADGAGLRPVMDQVDIRSYRI